MNICILGGAGFLGSFLTRWLEGNGHSVNCIGSREFDLTSPHKTVTAALSNIFRTTDQIVFLSAITPDKGKDYNAYVKNILMGKTVCDAIQLAGGNNIPLLYCSSDAVYPLEMDPSVEVSESSYAAPTDLYGLMHLSREHMLSETSNCLCITRLTMLFGPGDTHNSYGPNRFIRNALTESCITLGGNGEETRDHLWVNDAAEILGRLIENGSRGIFNVASGKSLSFWSVAQLIASTVAGCRVVSTKRTGPITYRSFDTQKLLSELRGLELTNLSKVIPTSIEVWN